MHHSLAYLDLRQAQEDLHLSIPDTLSFIANKYQDILFFFQEKNSKPIKQRKTPKKKISIYEFLKQKKRACRKGQKLSQPQCHTHWQGLVCIARSEERRTTRSASLHTLSSPMDAHTHTYTHSQACPTFPSSSTPLRAHSRSLTCARVYAARATRRDKLTLQSEREKELPTYLPLAYLVRGGITGFFRKLCPRVVVAAITVPRPARIFWVGGIPSGLSWKFFGRISYMPWK